jgi:hypothetical protein
VDWWINITDKVLTLLYVVDWWNNITDVISYQQNKLLSQIRQ